MKQAPDKVTIAICRYKTKGNKLPSKTCIGSFRKGTVR